MFYQKTRVKIATLERDKPNHMCTPWQGVAIFTNTVLWKTSLKKYLSVTKTYTLQNSMG
jgi:hypothetical protein